MPYKKQWLLPVFLMGYLLAHAQVQGLVHFTRQWKVGYKTIYGQEVIPPRFDGCGWGLLYTFQTVRLDGKCGLIDRTGNWVLPNRYDDLWLEENNHLRVGICYSFESWFGVTERSCRYGYLNMKGDTIIPIVYDYIYFSGANCITAKKNGKYGLLDSLGNVLIPFEYEQLDYRFSEGLLAARKDNQWGFIDSNNQVVIPFQYTNAEGFSDGLASVAIDYDSSGFINKYNNIVIPFHYDSYGSESFENGKAIVRKNDRYGIIDRNNQVLLPFTYYSLHEFQNGYAAILVDSGNRSDHHIIQYGYIDSVGNEYLYPYPVRKYSPLTIHVPPAPKALPDYSYLLARPYANENSPNTSPCWTLERLLEHALKAFRLEPVNYPDLGRLNQVSLAYGLLIGEGNYSEDFMDWKDESWTAFKKKTLFPIFSSEFLRQITWDWIGPLYKEQFQTMNPFEKKAYREIAEYLRTYINTYDRPKTEHFLDTDEARFAYYNADGYPDKHRKISAFVDRLILVHGLLSEKDAKRWINTLANEVETW